MSNRPQTPSIESLTFGLVHGAWHDASCWNRLTPLLADKGHHIITVDLPSDQPSATATQEIDAAAEQLQSEKDIVLVGHSRGANLLPHLVGRVSLRRLVYVAGSFQPPLLSSLGAQAGALPPRQSPAFRDGILPTGEQSTVYDPSRAGEMFYHDCSSDESQEAITHMRPQRRTHDWPPMAVWPTVTQDYIVCTDDKVINPAWSQAVCEALHIPIHEMPGGHSPFLSRPHALAELLLQIVHTSE